MGGQIDACRKTVPLLFELRLSVDHDSDLVIRAAARAAAAQSLSTYSTIEFTVYYASQTSRAGG